MESGEVGKLECLVHGLAGDHFVHVGLVYPVYRQVIHHLLVHSANIILIEHKYMNN